jgi:tetratricopeptide (TPR) repeat protein
VVRNRDWADSRTLWEATARTMPRCARAHSQLATIHFRAGRFEEARAAATASLAVVEDPRIRLRLGRIELALLTATRDRAAKQRHFEEAKKHFQAVIAGDGGDLVKRYAAGCLAFARGKSGRAIALLRGLIAELAKRGIVKPDMYEMLALAHLAAGDRAAAAAAYREVARLDPRLAPNIERILRRLEQKK